MSRRQAILTAGWLLPFVIALLFFWKGRQYDPAYFEPPAGALPSLAVPVSAAGWMLEGGESLSAERMYEKINGRAEFYLQYGATALHSGEWVAGEQRWDMYLYEFTDPQGARGAFIGERPARNSPLDGIEAYAVSGQVSALAGTFYLSLSAQQADADGAAAEELLRELIGSLGGAEPAASDAGQQLTPAALAGENAVPGSEGYIVESAFGFSAFSKVQTVQVSLNGMEALWFMSEGGAGALKTYISELSDYGGDELFEQDGGIGGSMFGSWEFTTIVDGVLWGVRDLSSKEDLSKHWKTLKTALEEQ